jgi:hypothetical protein
MGNLRQSLDSGIAKEQSSCLQAGVLHMKYKKSEQNHNYTNTLGDHSMCWSLIPRQVEHYRCHESIQFITPAVSAHNRQNNYFDNNGSAHPTVRPIFIFASTQYIYEKVM